MEYIRIGHNTNYYAPRLLNKYFPKFAARLAIFMKWQDLTRK